MNRKIVSNIFLVSILTILAKSLGFFREVALGNVFGVGQATDMYFQAFKLSIFLFLSAGGIITIALIPELLKSDQTQEKSYQIIHEFMSMLLVFASLMTLGMLIWGDKYASLVTPYSGRELIEFTKIIKIMFSTIFFFGPIYVYMSILHVNQKFLPNNLSSVLYNLLLIFYLVTVGKGFGVMGFSMVIFLGWAFQYIVLIRPVRKIGYKFRFTLKFWTPEIKKMIKRMPSIFIIISAFSMLNIGDTLATGSMSEGSTASLNFAFSLYGAFATTIILSISTVLFPEISSWVKNTVDASKIRVYINHQIGMMILVFLPIIVGVYIISDDIIKLFFSISGQFDNKDLLDTANVLRAYFLGFLAFGIFELLAKVYLAKENYKYLSLLTFILVISNFLINLLIRKSFGVSGIALSTSLLLICLSVVMWLRFGVEKKCILGLGKGLISVFIMAIFLNFLPESSDSQLGRIIWILVNTSLGLLIYSLVLILLKTEEMYIIRDLLWRKRNEEK